MENKFIEKRSIVEGERVVQQKPEDLEELDKQNEELMRQLNKIRGEDPSKMTKKELDYTPGLLKTLRKDISANNLLKGLYNYRGETPEEIEILKYCQQKLYKSMLLFGGVGFGTAMSINYYNRMVFGLPMKTFGIFVGVTCGSIYGMLQNNKLTTKLLISLGPEYEISRILIQELKIKREDLDKNLI